MRVDLYLHIPKEVQGQIDMIVEILRDVRDRQIRQGGLMSAAFDALKVEVEELKASSDLAIAKIDELRKLLEDLGGAPTEEQIAEVTAAVNAVEDALEGKAQDPPPPPQP